MPFEIDRRGVLIGAAATLLPYGGTDSQGRRKMLQPRDIMWRRVMDDLSFEQARICSGPTGPELSGTVLVAEQGAPLSVDYRVTCNEDWVTRTVEVSQIHLGERRGLRLEHDGAGLWWRDGREAPELAGCSDVDLGVSPSTNALPINRLSLHRGGEAAIRAAWVRFPSLEVVPAEQVYTRLGDRRYRYRSLASGFEAVVEADHDGLPIDYSGVWRRVAEGPAAAIAPDPAQGFVGALLASGPSAELGRVAADFGWLAGGWSARVSDYEADGSVVEASGEWWFAWVLEGRAMQDVWISPARSERSPHARSAKDRYGTSIRHFDHDHGVWRIAWINPVSGAINHLAGRRQGDRILLLGEEDGETIRWSFNEISHGSFRWLGETRRADGHWRKDAEFELRRIATSHR